MIFKTLKYGAVAAVGLGLVGGFFFGSDAASYLWSSAKSVQTAVKDSVPIEFELQRASDLIEEIIPEMHANVRLIAAEEVEIAALKEDIRCSDQALGEERARVAKIRDTLNVQKVAYALGGYDYSRQQVKQELARSFDRVKEAEVVLAGKHRLLDTREKSLQAAMQMLDKTRSQKARLEDQIQALASQHRLVKAASVGSRVQIDNSKLAQSEKLIAQIKKRLDVAERVLAHETHFVQPISVDVIDEKDLLAQVDEYLDPAKIDSTDGSQAIAMVPNDHTVSDAE